MPKRFTVSLFILNSSISHTLNFWTEGTKACTLTRFASVILVCAILNISLFLESHVQYTNNCFICSMFTERCLYKTNVSLEILPIFAKIKPKKKQKKTWCYSVAPYTFHKFSVNIRKCTRIIFYTTRQRMIQLLGVTRKQRFAHDGVCLGINDSGHCISYLW